MYWSMCRGAGGSLPYITRYSSLHPAAPSAVGQGMACRLPDWPLARPRAPHCPAPSSPTATQPGALPEPRAAARASRTPSTGCMAAAPRPRAAGAPGRPPANICGRPRSQVGPGSPPSGHAWGEAGPWPGAGRRRRGGAWCGGAGPGSHRGGHVRSRAGPERRGGFWRGRGHPAADTQGTWVGPAHRGGGPGAARTSPAPVRRGLGAGRGPGSGEGGGAARRAPRERAGFWDEAWPHGAVWWGGAEEGVARAVAGRRLAVALSCRRLPGAARAREPRPRVRARAGSRSRRAARSVRRGRGAGGSGAGPGVHGESGDGVTATGRSVAATAPAGPPCPWRRGAGLAAAARPGQRDGGPGPGGERAAGWLSRRGAASARRALRSRQGRPRAAFPPGRAPSAPLSRRRPRPWMGAAPESARRGRAGGGAAPGLQAAGPARAVPGEPRGFAGSGPSAVGSGSRLWLWQNRCGRPGLSPLTGTAVGAQVGVQVVCSSGTGGCPRQGGRADPRFCPCGAPWAPPLPRADLGSGHLGA